MDRKAFYGALRTRDSSVFGSWLSQKQMNGCETLLNEAGTEGAPLRFLAYMLATAYHETAATMQPITEYGRRSYFDKYEPGTAIGNRLGNTRKGDGYKYRGRGFVQLTGRDNYARAAKELAIDLVRYPDDALEPDIAAIVMFKGMTEGWFTGKKLSDTINLDKTDYYNARRIVNGTDKAAKIAGYAKTFETALREAEYASQAPKPPPMVSDAPRPHPELAEGPQQPPKPRASAAAPDGKNHVATAMALIVALSAAFWAVAADGWQHVISLIERIF